MSSNMFDNLNDARELITQAVGAGSTCWIGGTGDAEFDSTQALAVADAAYQRLQAIMAGLFAAQPPETDPIVTTIAELDALPLDTVVVDTAGIPRTKRHGDSHMPAGWTHAGRSPLRSHELADGRPMRTVYTPAPRSAPGPAEAEIIHAELACPAERIGHCDTAPGRYIHECRFDDDHDGRHECGCGMTWTDPDN